MKKDTATPNRLSANWILVLLSVLGTALVILYRAGLRAEVPGDIHWFLKIVGVQAPLYLAAVWLSLRRAADSRAALIVVLAFAALFRVSILFSEPRLSDDLYRYIWDGRVQAAGINPYRYIPADPALAHLRDEKIYPYINRREYAPTMYPPLAEAIFLLTTRVSESVTWMKATMVLFEGIAMWAIAQLLASFGLPRQHLLIYAWHPLAVWEFAGNGHFDAIVIAFIALALLARRKNAESVTGITLACATLVKFFPLVLLPALYKRWGWRIPTLFAATVVVAYLPYLGVGPRGVLGFLPGYTHEQRLVSGEQFFLLNAVRRLFNGSVPSLAYVIAALMVLVVLALWLWRNQRQQDGYIRSSVILASVFMILLSPHWPWYFAWLIPFLCFVRAAPIFYLTLASFLLYLTWYGDVPERVFTVHALLYVPTLILGVITLWLSRRKLQSNHKSLIDE